jgi:hypothetical protein
MGWDGGLFAAQESKKEQRAPNQADDRKPPDGEVQSLDPDLLPRLCEQDGHVLPGATPHGQRVGINGLERLALRDELLDLIREAIRWLKLMWLRRAGRRYIFTHELVLCAVVQLHLPPSPTVASQSTLVL